MLQSLLHVLLSAVVLGEPQQALACQDKAPQFALQMEDKVIAEPSSPARLPHHPSALSSNAAIVESKPSFALDQASSVLYCPTQDTYRSGRRMLSRHKQLQQGIHYARGPP